MKRPARRALLVAALAIELSMGMTAVRPPIANADPGYGCDTVRWGIFGSQLRTICDGPIRPDGSWTRHRVEGVPAHYANASSSCSGGAYYSSCTYSPGGFVAEYDTDDETYVVTPDTVLPDEPGWLPPGTNNRR